MPVTLLVIIIRSVWLHTHTDKHAHIRKRKHRREREDPTYSSTYEVRKHDVSYVTLLTAYCVCDDDTWRFESRNEVWEVEKYTYSLNILNIGTYIYNSAYYMKMYNLVIDIDDFLLLLCKVLLRAVNLTNSDIFHWIVIWMKYGIIGTCE